jgi:hypothetical protein
MSVTGELTARQIDRQPANTLTVSVLMHFADDSQATSTHVFATLTEAIAAAYPLLW